MNDDTILDAMPINRPCTVDDVRNRVKDRSGVDISPDAVKLAMADYGRSGLIDFEKFSVEKSSISIYTRRA